MFNIMSIFIALDMLFSNKGLKANITLNYVAIRPTRKVAKFFCYFGRVLHDEN